MPKIVDPDERRRIVFDAVFTIIAEQGVPAATLRAVADRAELAVGSVRHYFPSHEAILAEAAEEMAARVTARLEAHRAAAADTDDRLGAATALFAELLPLTASTRREVAVWLEFVVAARTQPVFAPVAARLRAGSDTLARALLTGWGWQGAELGVEAARLTALVDGLAMTGCLKPGRGVPREILAALRSHLAHLVP